MDSYTAVLAKWKFIYLQICTQIVFAFPIKNT